MIYKITLSIIFRKQFKSEYENQIEALIKDGVTTNNTKENTFKSHIIAKIKII